MLWAAKFDMRRTLARKQHLQFIDIVIEIDPPEAHLPRARLPFVGQEGLMRFLGTACGQDVMTVRRESIRERRA